MGETEEFNTLTFEKKLMQLKDTQESIQSLSSWCLKQRSHHKKIVSSWLNVLKRVKIEQRLVLFYLANDVIQYSKRKNYEFVESWGLNLQKATPLVRDEKVRPKILRIFKIWEQRSVYDDEFLSDLTGLLSAGAIKKTDDDPLDFQPQQLVNKIKQCAVLEADTEIKLQKIHNHDLELSDADELCANLKERSSKDDVEKELNEGISCVERYTQALQREIVARESLLALLASANQYYSTQRGEVKVVAYAYKNFGSRVRALKRKLDELIETLPSAAPSPPEHDEDVPSPGPDEDLDLPGGGENTEHEVAYNIDQTFNTSISADGSLYNLGLSSFLASDNPLSLFNDTVDLEVNNDCNMKVAKTSQPADIVMIDCTSPDNTSVGSVISTNISQKSQEPLPGLDLLTPDSTGNPPPPISFYGTMDSLVEESEVQYTPEAVPSPWINAAAIDPHATWIPPVKSARNVFAEPPASPPAAQRAPVTSATQVDVRQEAPAVDTDHRGLLPPPPPPPILPLLGHTEDVDHRVLPAPTAAPPIRHTSHQDIDHRNLISLTHQPTTHQTHNSISLDQDYRVPPMVPPPDIVESVDMDLSEDEEQGMYQTPQNQMERRNSFNNNKVLVGGDESNNEKNSNLMQINTITNRLINEGPHSAPAQIPPLSAPLFPPNVSSISTVLQHQTHVVSHTPTHTISTMSHSASNMSHPVSNMSHLASNMSHPASNMSHPASNLSHPASSLPHPAPSITHAATLPHLQPPPNMSHAPPVVSHIPSNVTHNAPPTVHSNPMRPHIISNVPLSAPLVPQMAPTVPQQASTRPQSAPVIPPLSNPFENMPPNLKFNMQNFQTLPPSYPNDDGYNENSEECDENIYEEFRNRDIDTAYEPRNPSPPEYPTFDDNWSNPGQPRPFMNQRFPRNWGPRTNFRPPFNPQFRPRNGPRPPNRWLGPRGQRFW